MCGATSKEMAEWMRACGLSPRVRRYPTNTRSKRPAVGSIAACAALPPVGPLKIAAYGVYRRVCGATPATK